MTHMSNSLTIPLGEIIIINMCSLSGVSIADNCRYFLVSLTSLPRCHAFVNCDLKFHLLILI